MVSSKQQGGTVTNYSPRFSITGLTGTTPLQYKQAAQELSGSTEGPPAVGNGPSPSSSTSASATSGSASQTPSQTLDQPNAGIVTATVTPTSAPTTSPSSTSSPSGSLSPGAIAGIAAACTFLGLALLAGLAAWYLRRRKQAEPEIEEIKPQNPFLDDKAELPAASEVKLHRAWTNFTELSAESVVVHEADSGERPPELDHLAFRAELEGSTPATPRSGF